MNDLNSSNFANILNGDIWHCYMYPRLLRTNNCFRKSAPKRESGSLINLMESWKKDWFIYSWFDGQLVRRRLVWRMVDQCLLWACLQPYSARSSSVSSKELIYKLDRGLINYLVKSFSPFSSFTSITIESWSQELNLRANRELIVRLSGSCSDRIMNIWRTQVLNFIKNNKVFTF